MDTNTLIDVVANIKSLHETACKTGNIFDCHTAGYLDALEDLMDYFQDIIDSDVASMETSMGM